jgi:hypothetical protein
MILASLDVRKGAILVRELVGTGLEVADLAADRKAPYADRLTAETSAPMMEA